MLVKHRQSPSPIGDVGRGHVDPMRQPLSIHCDVTLDSGHLLARVIALLPGAVRVLDALGVHDAEAGLLFATIASPGRANQFFSRPAPEWILSPGQAARSIAGNTCSKCANRGSPQGASATGTRFSRDTAPRRKHHTSPRCGAWYGGEANSNAGTILANCSRLMSLRYMITPPLGNRLNLSYFRDRKHPLRSRTAGPPLHRSRPPGLAGTGGRVPAGHPRGSRPATSRSRSLSSADT